MKKWNPFGKVDVEIGSFLENSRFNKSYSENSIEEKKTAKKHMNSVNYRDGGPKNQ